MAVYDLTRGKNIGLNINSITSGQYSAETLIVNNILPITNISLIPDQVLLLNKIPCCKLRKSGTQLIPGSSYTNLTWDIEDFDNNSFHNNTNPERLTCSLSGVYLISFQVQWDSAGSSALFGAALYRNNNTFVAYQELSGMRNTICNKQSVLLSLSINDYITVRVVQNISGPGFNVLPTNTFVSIYKV